ncbi:hypothetical protein [Faecalibacillus faecis]|uniref:hypothetical protein n=1 Tax=Faecalibacillus faecis TaxID=1982628 RepID=UPI00386612C2
MIKGDLSEKDFWNMQNAINECLTTGESKFTAEDGREYVVENDYIKNKNEAYAAAGRDLNNFLRKIKSLRDDDVIQVDVKSARLLAKSTLLFIEQEIEE